MRGTLGRPHIVQTALNDAELAALRKKADQEGLSVTAFLRQLVIKNTPVHSCGAQPIELKPPGESTEPG